VIWRATRGRRNVGCFRRVHVRVVYPPVPTPQGVLLEELLPQGGRTRSYPEWGPMCSGTEVWARHPLVARRPGGGRSATPRTSRVPKGRDDRAVLPTPEALPSQQSLFAINTYSGCCGEDGAGSRDRVRSSQQTRATPSKPQQAVFWGARNRETSKECAHVVVLLFLFVLPRIFLLLC